MKKHLSEALTRLVSGYELRTYTSNKVEAADLERLKADLHDQLKFCYHHLTADAQGFIDRAGNASTMHYALTCITAAAAGLLTSYEIDRQMNEHITSNVTAQVDSLAMKATTRHVGLLDGLAQLQRYDIEEKSGNPFASYRCIEEDEFGDYLKREDVIRLLGGNPEEHP